jgi:hypothetical protein
MFFTSSEVQELHSLLQLDLYLTAKTSPAGKWTRVLGISKVNCMLFFLLASARRFSGGPGRTEEETCSI